MQIYIYIYVPFFEIQEERTIQRKTPRVCRPVERTSTRPMPEEIWVVPTGEEGVDPLEEWFPLLRRRGPRGPTKMLRAKGLNRLNTSQY